MALKKRISKNKRLKKQLTDKINSISKRDGLLGLKKTLEYYPVLKEDQDWDYDFLFDLMIFKLQRMKNYFQNAQIAMDSKIYAQQINTAIKLINIGFRNDEVETDKYVNLKNANRFLTKEQLEFYTKVDSKKGTKYLPNELRMAKAIKLFGEYFVFKVMYWWD
jgi:hypothetical protein